MLIWLRCLSINFELFLLALVLAGCATATVTPSWQTDTRIAPPEQIVVYDFVFSPGDIKPDRSFGSKLTALINASDSSQEILYLGRAMASILSRELIIELRLRGIKAYRGRGDALPNVTASTIRGRLLSIDEGNGSMRTLVGFGLGRTETRTQVQLRSGVGEDALLLAEATTTAKSNLIPGLPSIIGAAGAGGAAWAGAALGGMTMIANERFFAANEADIKRTAKELADWVTDYYRQQGWLTP